MVPGENVVDRGRGRIRQDGFQGTERWIEEEEGWLQRRREEEEWWLKGKERWIEEEKE